MRRDGRDIPVFYVLVDTTTVDGGKLKGAAERTRLSALTEVETAALGVNENGDGTRAIVKMPADKELVEREIPNPLRIYSEAEIGAVRALVETAEWMGGARSSR